MERFICNLLALVACLWVYLVFNHYVTPIFSDRGFIGWDLIGGVIVAYSAFMAQFDYKRLPVWVSVPLAFIIGVLLAKKID